MPKPCYGLFHVRGDSSIYSFSQVWVIVFYYDRISVKEGIDLETYEHRDECIDECLSKRCEGYCVLFYIKNNFNYKERICDKCLKILLKTELEPKDIPIILLNNYKYRVLNNLRRGQAQRLMERENRTDRYGYIDISKMNPNEI